MVEVAQGTRAAGGFSVPMVQIVLLALCIAMLAIGGSVTFGTWGDLDLQLAMAYVVPALLLHAFSASARRPRLWPRVFAWILIFAMCVHTVVLLQPPVIATLALLALLDCGLHSTRVPKGQASLAARIVAASTVLVTLGLLAFLYQFATFDAMVRLGATTVLGAALVIACALYPAMRAPQRLLPALGVYYLAFVLMAAPVLPFGPAIAWWFLCASVFLGAIVAARHVSGTELPEGQRRHEHVIHAMPDPFLAADSQAVERWLAHGEEAAPLSRRIEAARGRQPTGTTLSSLADEIAEGRPRREHREYALRNLLENPE